MSGEFRACRRAGAGRVVGLALLRVVVIGGAALLAGCGSRRASSVDASSGGVGGGGASGGPGRGGAEAGGSNGARGGGGDGGSIGGAGATGGAAGQGGTGGGGIGGGGLASGGAGGAIGGVGATGGGGGTASGGASGQGGMAGGGGTGGGGGAPTCNVGYRACGGVCAKCPDEALAVVCEGTSCVSAPELFPAGPGGQLDGYLLVKPCGGNGEIGTDCGSAGAYYRGARIQCSGGALDVVHTLPVGGAPGTTYRIQLHFYGIVEPRNYGPDAIREAGPGRPGNQDIGAYPSPWAVAPAGHVYPTSDYDTWELRVDNEVGQEVAVYYLNADTSEGHWTYVLNFEKQIAVIGGGRIRLHHHDGNCRLIKNCGPMNTPVNQCGILANARIINISAAMPLPATLSATQGGLLQPNLTTDQPDSQSGQWVLIDLVRINSAQ